MLSGNRQVVSSWAPSVITWEATCLQISNVCSSRFSPRISFKIFCKGTQYDMLHQTQLTHASLITWQCTLFQVSHSNMGSPFGCIAICHLLSFWGFNNAAHSVWRNATVHILHVWARHIWWSTLTIDFYIVNFVPHNMFGRYRLQHILRLSCVLWDNWFFIVVGIFLPL